MNWLKKLFKRKNKIPEYKIGIYYHGTSKENWKRIQEEGILYGVRDAPSRCTYLTPMKDEARRYGDVLLEVKYKPNGIDDNYYDGCWQFRVYTPILLKDINLVK